MCFQPHRPAVIALAAALLSHCALDLSAQAAASRYALVIGNGDYADMGKLKR